MNNFISLSFSSDSLIIAHSLIFLKRIFLVFVFAFLLLTLLLLLLLLFVAAAAVVVVCLFLFLLPSFPFIT